MNLDALEAALRTEGARVARRDDALSVSIRPGIRALDATLDASSLPAVGDLEEADRRAATASFARGVVAALAETPNSGGEDVDFNTAAATILPLVESRWFADGVAATGADRPFLTGLTEQLVVAYEIELDDCVHVLGAGQAARWGATADRIHKAAVSILFHRSWGMEFAPTDDAKVEAFDGRDGRDAARLTMLDLWDHARVREGLAVCVPSPGRLLVSTDVGDGGLARLADVGRRAFDEAESPLSHRVWCFSEGRLEQTPA